MPLGGPGVQCRRIFLCGFLVRRHELGIEIAAGDNNCVPSCQIGVDTTRFVLFHNEYLGNGQFSMTTMNHNGNHDGGVKPGRGYRAGLVSVLAGLLVGAATGAAALDVKSLQSRTLPPAGTYEQAKLCAATLLYEAYLLKDDNTIPNHEAWSQKAGAGGHLWVWEAYRQSTLYSATSPDESDFVKTIVLPDIKVLTELHDYDAFKFYVDYCSLQTDAMASKIVPEK